MKPTVTEIRVNERGDEFHESWVLIGASHVSTSPPGHWLFDSELPHQHFIRITVKRCSRKRDLSRDWIHATKTLLEVDMSEAQWGAFVSSFNRGDGVPATLAFLVGAGNVPRPPAESRFDRSHEEVRESGTKALGEVNESYQRVLAAFESGGKRALREELRSMGIVLENAPLNMEFAAKSLTEHVENVVTKARADIEGMALAAVERGQLPSASVFELESGEGESDDD